ncbi:hypothetical protein TNCV_737371 [Trichonephila clavipes]|nr:hypothetical protein TNCV_737371 [Trichonephila clavipes]
MHTIKNRGRSARSSNARELDEQILEVKINPQEKKHSSDTSTNKDTLSKEKESENENEETKLIRNDFAHYVDTLIDADLREQILKLGPYQPEGGAVIEGVRREKRRGGMEKTTWWSGRTWQNERDSDYVGEDRNEMVLTT